MILLVAVTRLACVFLATMSLMQAIFWATSVRTRAGQDAIRAATGRDSHALKCTLGAYCADRLFARDLPPGRCGCLPGFADYTHRYCAHAALTGRLALAIDGDAAEMGVDVIRSSMIGRGREVCAPELFVAGDNPPLVPGWPAPVACPPNHADMDNIAVSIEL